MFNYNMEISETRKDRVVTHVAGVHIEFDDAKLCNISVTSLKGLVIYIAKKKTIF